MLLCDDSMIKIKLKVAMSTFQNHSMTDLQVKIALKINFLKIWKIKNEQRKKSNFNILDLEF